jgi:hypothetical protein
MKYLVIVVGGIALAAAGLSGYLYFSPDYLSGSQPQSCSVPVAPSGNDELNARIKQLQDELFTVQNTVHQQSLEIAQLKSGNSRISDLSDRLKAFQMSAGSVKSGPDSESAVSSSVSVVLDSELFRDPEFAKLFVSKVEDALKVISEKERAEQAKRLAEQAQRRITQRIDEFAKAQNLTDFQKQELNKIVADRAAKSLELFSQMRPTDGAEPQVAPDQMRTQMDALRTESNEKVKQVLSPIQYEEYQKIENSLAGGGRGNFRQGNNDQNVNPRRAPRGGDGAQPGR